jgi:hypothetical protein
MTKADKNNGLTAIQLLSFDYYFYYYHFP